MALRFLLDANLPRMAVDAVRQAGHEVEFARDIGLGNAADEAIAARARDTGAVLVTRDLDFADVRQYPPEHYEGIVVLRLADDAVASEIAAAVRRFVSAGDFLCELRGRLAIVEGDRVRFRPPLPER
jgi:predicted nuclease of predicted toxin-antitoxin system